MSIIDLQPNYNGIQPASNHINKKSCENVIDLIKIIETSGLSSKEIMTKYNISSHHFYKIVREYNLKPIQKRSGPKNTKFKQLLYGTEEEQKASKIFPEGFVIEDFIKDSKNDMTIAYLMSKYKLTLYQIRELRIKLHLKTK